MTTLWQPPLFAVGTGRCGTHFAYELFRQEELVSAHHELHPMSAAYQRYVEWNRLPVDHASFLELKRNDIQAAAANGRRFFEASAYHSLSIERLSRAFDARFVLLVRHPLAVIASFLKKGWYAVSLADADPSLALGYGELGQPHHGFSRLAPRGEARRNWSQLSRAGRLAWFWATINKSVLAAFDHLPAGRAIVQSLEDFDFEAYVRVARLMALPTVMARDRFEETRRRRPGHFAGAGDVAFSALELGEIREQCEPVARQLGYSFSGETSETSYSVAAPSTPSLLSSSHLQVPPLLATIGSRNSESEAIDWMLDSGVRGFRINFARMSLEANLRVLDHLQSHPAANSSYVQIDLPGRKMRLAPFRGGPSRDFRAGETVRLVAEHATSSCDDIPVATPEFFAEVAAGDRLTFSSSQVLFQVSAVSDGTVTARVLEGGRLWKASGIWIAGPCCSYDRLWSRDRELIPRLASRGVCLALSFADTTAVIQEARKLAGVDVPIVAKIESPAALAAWPQLVNEADAVMIGRDDLSRILPLDTIDEWMSRRSDDALHASKPFIAASHYMDSVVASGTLSERDRDSVTHVLGRGWSLCLSETGHTDHWRAMILAALDLVERS